MKTLHNGIGIVKPVLLLFPAGFRLVFSRTLGCIGPDRLPILLDSAQAPAQLSWAELVVILLFPAPGLPPTRNNTEIA